MFTGKRIKSPLQFIPFHGIFAEGKAFGPGTTKEKEGFDLEMIHQGFSRIEADERKCEVRKYDQFI